MAGLLSAASRPAARAAEPHSSRQRCALALSSPPPCRRLQGPPPPGRLVAAGSRRRRLAAAAVGKAEEDELEVSGGFCLPAFVSADNKRSKCFTVLEVEVADYPGLLRVISWTLNGLDVVAQNAVVRTSPDGQAHNTFWLTSRSGHKLSDAAAELLAERVRDFVMYCSPDDEAKDKTEFCAGPVILSNSIHPDYTVVMVQEPRPTPGFLLEVASALSGMNVQILQGVVQGGECTEDDEPAAQLDMGDPAWEQQLDNGACLLAEEDRGGRVFRFLICDETGQKLGYGAISALLYTLTSVLGYRQHPTVPPEQEVLMGAR